jgi:hypothetical protein
VKSTSIAVALALFAGIPLPAITVEAHIANGAAEPAQCEVILARLHDIEMAAIETLAQIHDHRQEAEQLAEWYGPESFAPYIAVLRQQEMSLTAELEEIRVMRCLPPTPSNPSER